MTNNIKYYLIEGIANSNPDKKLNSRMRIAAIPNDFPFRPSNLIGHNSIRHLRHFDNKWKELKKTKGKIADKICDSNFILEFHDFILTPNDNKFNKYSFALLEHTIHGDYDNNFQGLHLLCRHNKDIIRIDETKPVDKNGVWEARVFLFNERRQKTYEKVSTFFPKNWTPSHFMYETFTAIDKLEIVNTVTEYNSVTESGVPVMIIMKNGRAKSIYPIYSENNASS